LFTPLTIVGIVIIKRGVEVAEFDKRAPRVRAVLEAQGWTDMVEDHCPTVEEIVCKFYVNLHQRRGSSFRSWIRGSIVTNANSKITEEIEKCRIENNITTQDTKIEVVWHNIPISTSEGDLGEIH
jgi:hypothetical protein